MPKSKSRPSAGRNEQLKKQFKSEYKSGKTPNELLDKFKAMELHFQDKDLIKELMLLANIFYGVPDKVMYFGKRALKVLLDDENSDSPRFGLSDCGTFVDTGFGNTSNATTYPSGSFFISCVLMVLARASLGLSWYNEALAYADWAGRNFRIILRYKDNYSCSPTLVMGYLVAVQRLMAEVKVAMGLEAEVPGHLINIVEIQEMMFGKWSNEVAEANTEVQLAYVAIGKVNEAEPFRIEAKAIYERHSEPLPEKVASVPNNENGEDISDAISKCGISDD